MNKKTIPFDTLKKKAKSLLGISAQVKTGILTQTGWLDDTAFKILIHLAINKANYAATERPGLASFASAYMQDAEPGSTDHVAAVAQQAALKPFDRSSVSQELSLIALKAREEASIIIDRWDVRCVAQLIEAFPGIVANKYQQASIHIFMADNENGDWMVELDPSKKRN